MSLETQIISKIENDSPIIELWSSNDSASISIGYDATNSLFSIASGNSLDSNQLLTISDTEISMFNSLNMNTNRIINVGLPTEDNDACTKTYLENLENLVLGGGTGITVSGGSYNLDSSQTQITEVGELTTGSISTGFGSISISGDLDVNSNDVNFSKFFKCKNADLSLNSKLFHMVQETITSSGGNINTYPPIKIINNGGSFVLDNSPNFGGVFVIIINGNGSEFTIQYDEFPLTFSTIGDTATFISNGTKWVLSSFKNSMNNTNDDSIIDDVQDLFNI